MISQLTIPDPVLAQVKGGLSASSVNPNSTIGERTGNTTEDLMPGGTSVASVRDGLPMTTSPSSERTGNTTNLTSTEGGLSASSVNNAEKEWQIVMGLFPIMHWVLLLFVLLRPKS